MIYKSTAIPDLAEIWLNNIVVQAVVGEMYNINFPPQDPDWDVSRVSYYPVWFKTPNSRKSVKYIKLQLDQRPFKAVTPKVIATASLASAQELFECLQKTRAVRVKYTADQNFKHHT